MDFSRLRDALYTLVVPLKDSGTHTSLPSICAELGLPAPPEHGSSKRDKMIASLEAAPNVDLPRIAMNVLRRHPPPPRVRNSIQELLWADVAVPHVPKRHRRELARNLELDDICIDCARFDRLLSQLWVLQEDWEIHVFQDDGALAKDIDQHVYRNKDWSVEYLFEKLGAFDASDQRFVAFIEGLSSAEVLPDEQAQRRYAEGVNSALRACGAELRETGTNEGYPVFTLASTRSASLGRPKNVIFASPVKPDIRIKDAVSNDVEIVSNADRVLVYDRAIGGEGLRWRDLQAWWADDRGITDSHEAKATLYRRLRESLPINSPPQMLLFDAYYRGFGAAIPDLPALLPEVWLHWDPVTVRERGAEALLRFRMDFLLLMPHGTRVVVEVDGQHHYARDDGRADSRRYGAMVAADRELRLAGYEVFRFGADELRSEAPVRPFFDALFKRFGVVPLRTAADE